MYFVALGRPQTRASITYTCGIHCECGQSLALYIACTALTHAVAAAPLLVAAASGTDEGLMACYAPYKPYTQMLI